MITTIHSNIIHNNKEYNDYYTFIQILYIITQEYNDYYTIHSNIIHNQIQ